MTSRTLPTFFISHGGGPWPWMEGKMRDARLPLASALREIPHMVGAKPKAVLMVSAHWEESEFALMTHEHPPMFYDYNGFPDSTYHVEYPAPGAPLLAERVCGLLRDASIAVQLDPTRGIDHGAFVPMAVMYPEADVPILQLSLKHGLDPHEHITVGRALAPLRDEGVLILGSGSSIHNVRLLGQPDMGVAAFDDWLHRALVGGYSEARTSALISWATAPMARIAHPREEHLLPLMVALGAAERDKGTCIYHDDKFFGTGVLSNFMFGDGS